MIVDQQEPLALYEQVQQFVLKNIEDGNWASGHKLPSENQLVLTLGLSRMTVHRALRELADKGILIRKPGVGTFVAPPTPETGLVEVRSIVDDIAQAGGSHSAIVHLLKAEPAQHRVAAALELGLHEEVFHSIIVHKNNGIPVQLAERWVNPKVAPGYLQQDFQKISPHQYLQHVAPIQQVQHIVEAVSPDPGNCQLLEITPREPCLLLLRRTWALGMVATDNRFLYPGSRFRFGGRFKVGGP